MAKKNIKSRVVKRVLHLALFDNIKSIGSQRSVTSEFYTTHDKPLRDSQ